MGAARFSSCVMMAGALLGCETGGGFAADAALHDASLPAALGDSAIPVTVDSFDAAWLPDAALIAHDGGALLADASDVTADVASPPLNQADAAPATDAAAMASFDGAFGPPPPANAWAAEGAFATQHGDTAASDTTPFAGPGARRISMQTTDLLAACPSLFMTKSGQLLAVCTQILDRAPAVYLLSAQGSAPQAMLALTAGTLFGGVYPYLDHQDHLMIVDGAQKLLRIAAEAGSSGSAALRVVESIDLAGAVPSDCGRAGCDTVVGLLPDHDGRIWFATDGAVVGVLDRTTRQIKTLTLPSPERIVNSIASAPSGTAVVTDRALYLLRAGQDGAPEQVFRAEYDRGSARKPGQLSHGSGSTPTFFGPSSGAEYIAILDNARPAMHLLVFHARTGGQLACSIALPLPTGHGSESSPIGVGRSVIVSSSYGYPYPALPEGIGASEPAVAPLSGGMTRVDLDDGPEGCKVVWSNTVRSAAVAKLSLADNLIYTFERTPLSDDGVADLFDRYAYLTVDALTGAVAYRQELPDLADTLQLAGMIGRDGALYQGTVLGFVRVTAAP
jgi:hypothetical protein